MIPVGGGGLRQALLKLTRTGEDAWDRQDLGGVRFVPLIGAQGWGEDRFRR